MDARPVDVHRDDHPGVRQIGGQPLLLAQIGPAIPSAAAGKLNEVDWHLFVPHGMSPAGDQRSHLVLVVAGIFRNPAVRLALIPDRTAYSEPCNRGQARVEQPAWQPVGVPCSYTAWQSPDGPKSPLSPNSNSRRSV